MGIFFPKPNEKHQLWMVYHSISYSDHKRLIKDQISKKTSKWHSCITNQLKKIDSRHDIVASLVMIGSSYMGWLHSCITNDIVINSPLTMILKKVDQIIPKSSQQKSLHHKFAHVWLDFGMILGWSKSWLPCPPDLRCLRSWLPKWMPLEPSGEPVAGNEIMGKTIGKPQENHRKMVVYRLLWCYSSMISCHLQCVLV